LWWRSWGKDAWLAFWRRRWAGCVPGSLLVDLGTGRWPGDGVRESKRQGWGRPWLNCGVDLSE